MTATILIVDQIISENKRVMKKIIKFSLSNSAKYYSKDNILHFLKSPSSWLWKNVQVHWIWAKFDPNMSKQAQNLCIDASVDQFWKELKFLKSFAISRSLLKCFKNQNKLRICANFVYFPFTQFSMLSPYFFILLNSKFFAGVNQSQQNSKNCWCFNYAY